MNLDSNLISDVAMLNFADVLRITPSALQKEKHNIIPLNEVIRTLILAISITIDFVMLSSALS